MITKNQQQTIDFGKDIAKHLAPGDVVALIGDLGSGKTTLTKGIADGLGVKNSKYVNSPSFVLIREYKAKINLYHFDLYRLDSVTDMRSLGLEEYFNSDGVSVIEWAQKLEELLPQEHIRIEINIIDKDTREISIKTTGKRYENISSRYINENN